ncbi:MAG: glucose 1-dehydrogenase [Chloroflexi bacterium]|nr:glucose 1-dehydrogenase [Chloroflexota bacterium]
MFKLDGRVAIVTGSSSGLGVSLARALAEAGADLALVARTESGLQTTAELVRETGRRALVVPTDVTKLDQVERMAERVVTELGRVDILVNNAGIAEPKLLLNVSEAEWLKIIDTNLNATYRCVIAVGRHLVKQGHGKVINIASMVSQSAVPGLAAYAASKAGVVMFTKNLALEWARHNVQVNAIAPGYFATPMNNKDMENPQFAEALLKRIPMRRLGRPEELGPLVVYLASDASNYMTGETVNIDGGYVLP